ncbi:MAG: 30S ribosomal protein S17e [Nanoarchaeota archaeon]
MGRVKTQLTKRLARELMEMYPDKFSDKFDDNKKILDETIDVKSKKIRNTISGYLVRLTRQKQQEA